MQGTVSTNLKKKLLIGVGLSALVITAIVTGVYAAHRADANQPSSSVVVVEEADMQINLDASDWLVKPDNLIHLTDFASSASSGGRQGVANSNVEVRVNGKSIDAPENGSVHKKITTQDGSTSIKFWARSNTTSGESFDQSSINVDVNSSVEMRNDTRE